MYKLEEPADNAEAGAGGVKNDARKGKEKERSNALKKQALAMCGSTLIPALWMAITQAEEAALPVLVTRLGSLDGQIKPSIKTPTM